MTPRHLFLGAALLATLAAAFWPRPPEEVVGAVAPAAGKAPSDGTTKHSTKRANDARQVAAYHQPLMKPLPFGIPPGGRGSDAENLTLGPMQADLFPAQSWRPPPPPPPKQVASPPPAPVAPPLPFQYLGRWQEGASEVVFLGQGNDVVRAKVGDTLAGWRLDRADNNSLVFTWTALNQQQILRIAP